MPRLAVFLFLLCTFSIEAQEPFQLPPAQPFPVYRGAEPFTATKTTRGFMGTVIDVEKTLAKYPETMQPWKPEDLQDVKIYLPLGEGESINDKLYHFTAEWNDETLLQPLRIRDFNFPDYSNTDRDFERRFTAPEWRFRPIELAKNNVVRFKFDFVPIKFQPLDLSEATDFGSIRDKTAPVPEFLDPIVIHGAQIKLFVNGRNHGFDVHFSRDGEKWYSMDDRYSARIPFQMLPFDILFVRVSTDNDEPIKSMSFDFEAILETHGFRGTGETVIGNVRRIERLQKNVDCPLAFLDGSGDLQMIIDNREDEPLRIGSVFSRSYSTQDRFMAGGGSVLSDGLLLGPTIPPQSLGVFSFRIGNDRPGEHSYGFSVGPMMFRFAFLVPGDDDAELPPFRRDIIFEGVDEPPRGREYKPEDGRPFVTFDDAPVISTVQ